MSETSDDARQLAGSSAAPAAVDPAPDADDVEVLVAPEAPEGRHDSVLPTSRKLAPPPKPKRDSNQPGSVPPPGSSVPPLVDPGLGSLKAPSAPSISFHEASAPSHDTVAAALASSAPLNTIGEALSNDVGAFSANETPTGGRPPVPRSRSQTGLAAVTGAAPSEPARTPSGPPRPRDKVPTKPDDALASAPTPRKAPSIRAQRIISIGTPSSPPPPMTPAPAPVDLDRTLESAAEEATPPRFNAPPAPAVAAPPAPAPAAAVAPPAAAPPAPVAAAPVVDNEAPPEIPITTDDDEEPTSPNASSAPLEVAAAVERSVPPPVIPAEPTPAPPELAPRAEPLAAEDVDMSPDSGDRVAVEELSREDSPSIPPDEPTPMMPAARAEAKPPPPPKRAPAPTAAPAKSEEKKPKQKKPWWEELFSEDFVRANWKVSDEQIKREVTFVEESLGVAPGGVVLDLGCGSGQHAVELASRGYGVVGYDLSLYQLALAGDLAQERSQKINFLQGDMREMAFEEMFDGIFCWNTSFGYFEEDKNFSVAERAFRALRPGGMLLVDVMNRDFAAAHTPSSVWFEGDACVCMDDAVIDYFTSRLRVKRSVILDDGRTRECTYSVRLYSFHELGKLLHEVGFRVTEVSGHPATPGVFLGQASPRILMLAQRP
jgi:SAM-dependent methyltransferase